jgi:hypothetical protein
VTGRLDGERLPIDLAANAAGLGWEVGRARSTALSTRRVFLSGAAAVCLTAAGANRAAAAGTYAQTIVAKQPVGYWRLGERSGSAAADSSGNHRDGVYHGDPHFGEPGAIVGDSAGAVRFGGHDDYVEIPDDARFSQPTSGRGLSVEAWLRPDVLTFAGQTSAKYVHWLGKGEPDAFEWGFRFYSLDSPTRPNRISAYIWNAAGGEGAGSYFQDELVAGRWIHIVACFDPGDRTDPRAGVSIYRDGVLRESPQRSRGARYASYDLVPAHGGAPLRFATRDRGSFLIGALADVALYPRVLDAAEIAENYRVAGR